FFQGIGIISGGIFIKDMNKFIFDSRGIESGGQFDGFDYKQPVNGAGANLFGVELTWEQQFTKLPGFLSGFGIYANYTYTKSSNIDLGPDTNRDDIDLLPYQMENVSNFALTYQKSGLTARLSANFSGKFLEEVGQDAANDIWRDNFTQWDFTAEYSFSKSLGIFIEFNNIGNEPRYNYVGIPSRAREHGLNGSTVNGGLKWSL
ncbi:MAG TPA: TonB-dependent receptor, partial [Flavobacteriaceae bacterium]|nr:TonB-dependent receptor [Flavobacteriaceae bacterium]